MSYAKQIEALAGEIQRTASNLTALEKSKQDWLDGSRNGGAKTIFIGAHIPMHRTDGSVNPMVEAIHKEVIKAHDEQIFKVKSQLEGQRWKLVQIAKATQ